MASRKPIDRPVVAIPPLRPEAPNATVSRSKTATLAPLRARCRAAESPVSPAPTTATSTCPPTSVEDRSGPCGEVSSQYGVNFMWISPSSVGGVDDGGHGRRERVCPVTSTSRALYVVNNLQLTICNRTGHSGRMTSAIPPPGHPPAAPSGPAAGSTPDATLEVLDPENGGLVGTVGDCSAGRRRRGGARGGAGGADRTCTGRSGSAVRRCTRAAALLEERRGLLRRAALPRGLQDHPRRGPRGAARGRDRAPLRRAGRPPRGPDPPLRRHAPRREPARLVHPRAGRRGRRDHAVQRPAQPGRPQGGAGPDRRQRRRPQARRADPADRTRLHRAPARRRRSGRPGRRAARSRRHRRGRAGQPPAGRPRLVHRRLHHRQRRRRGRGRQEDR